MAAHRTLRWTALTCRYGDVDVCFGLAATLDDDLAGQLYPHEMAAFPYQSIRVAKGSERRLPLRFYVVRDASIMNVRRLPGSPLEEGYERVSLEFYIEERGGEAAAPEDREHVRPIEPVMAFVLTVGLSRDVEERFFNEIIKRFLQHTWMTMPRLLREVGCIDLSTPGNG